MTESTIYWISRLDAVVCIFNGILCTALIGLLISLIGSFFIRMVFIEFLSKAEEESIIKLKQLICKAIIVFSIMFSIGLVGKTFIPTTKEYCAMVVIPNIVNNQNTKQVSKEIVAYAKQWLVDNLKTKASNENSK